MAAIFTMITATLEALPLNLIELLIALILSSMILILLSQNLSNLSLDALHFKHTTENEDTALLALLLLQHQLQSSQETECTPTLEPSYRIINTPEKYGLSIDTLEDTFYINNADSAKKTLLSQHWSNKYNPTILLDDCLSAASLPMDVAQSRLETVNHFPLSVSLKVTREYLWDQGTITMHQEHDTATLFQNITDFVITATPTMLTLQITPKDAHAPFSIHYTPST